MALAKKCQEGSPGRSVPDMSRPRQLDEERATIPGAAKTVARLRRRPCRPRTRLQPIMFVRRACQTDSSRSRKPPERPRSRALFCRDAEDRGIPCVELTPGDWRPRWLFDNILFESRT